ncbi:MAG: hypothetical protein JSR33_09685 [Proteobacteria bacterium]|nr:hypothetical protein [Pseudomonadota bacterium]
MANRYLKLIGLLLITTLTGCHQELAPTPPSEFQFNQSNQQTALVAFSVQCLYLWSPIDRASIYFKNVQTNHQFIIPMHCSDKPSNKGIEVLELPAGLYTLDGALGVKLTFSAGNRFDFTLLPHRLTYLGRIYYIIGRQQVKIVIYNENKEDFPLIKRAVPKIPVQTYRVNHGNETKESNEAGTQ